MPLFIALSLTLCFLVQNASPLQSLLITPLLIYIGLGLAVIGMSGSLLKKLSTLVWYDIFASGALIVWFAYWKPLFKDDSPLFFFYPLYFALMTAFASLFFINQRDKIDDESFRLMRFLSQKSITQPWIIMLGVFGSLGFEQHFMLYPVMVTLLIIRFTLASCLQGRGIK